MYYRVGDQRTLQLIGMMREVFCGILRTPETPSLPIFNSPRPAPSSFLEFSLDFIQQNLMLVILTVTSGAMPLFNLVPGAAALVSRPARPRT